jgi:flagellar hook-length control protein FliK
LVPAVVPPLPLHQPVPASVGNAAKERPADLAAPVTASDGGSGSSNSDAPVVAATAAPVGTATDPKSATPGHAAETAAMPSEDSAAAAPVGSVSQAPDLPDFRPDAMLPRATASAAEAPSPANSASPSPAAQQVAPVLIHLARSGGKEAITVSLHPVELGRVEIRVAHQAAGAQAVQVSAERPETLRALVADQSHLHRALERAGVAIEPGGLNFDLAGASSASTGLAGDPGTGSRGGAGGGRSARSFPRGIDGDTDDTAPDFFTPLRSGIDITA